MKYEQLSSEEQRQCVEDMPNGKFPYRYEEDQNLYWVYGPGDKIIKVLSYEYQASNLVELLNGAYKQGYDLGLDVGYGP